MTIKEALEKTIEVWTERLESDEYVDTACPICEKCDSPFLDCEDCPAYYLGDIWGAGCSEFSWQYQDCFAVDFTQNPPQYYKVRYPLKKKLICEQAIGYADMLLQEVKP
jgi:hypothetical protein